MKKLLILSISFLLVSACSSGPSIDGRWKVEQDGNVFVFEFKEGVMRGDRGDDGTYELDNVGYRVSGETLTISETDPESDCPDEDGVYKIALSETDLSLTKESDPCEGRSRFLDGLSMTRE